MIGPPVREQRELKTRRPTRIPHLRMWIFNALLTVCFAEFIIYRGDKQPLKPDDEEEVLSLHRRLLAVQWPTVMDYINKEKETFADFDHLKTFGSCLANGENVNCSRKAAKQLIETVPKYEVEWVPDTIFQLALLVALSKEKIFYISYLGEAKVSSEFCGGNITEEVNSASNFQEFLTKSTGYGASLNLDRLYLLVDKYLWDFKEREDWSHVVDKIFLDFATMKAEKLYSCGKEGSYKQWLDPGYSPMIKAYLKEELEAAQKNEYILSRGNDKGIKVQVQSDSKVEEVDAFDFPTFRYSLSFGQRLLDGSMFEYTIPGARSLTYLYDIEGGKFNQGYFLRLPMLDYLVALRKRLRGEVDSNLTDFNIFYVPPLSAIGGLFSWGEVFHARTKLGRSGFKGGFEPYRPSALMRDDRFSQFGIFREQRLSSFEFVRVMLGYMTKVKSFSPNEEFTNRIEGQKTLLDRLEKMKNVTFYGKDADGKLKLIFITSIPEPTIVYDRNNPLYGKLKGLGKVQPSRRNEKKRYEAFSSPATAPLVKTHLMVSLRGEASKFVQFWDLIYYGTDEQLEDFFRGIHQAAVDNADLLNNGYRMVMDNYGYSTESNYAGQTIPHLAAHLGGGEALGPVLNRTLKDPIVDYCQGDVDPIKERFPLPDTKLGGFVIRSYVAIYKDQNRSNEIILEILKDGKHAYKSIDDFAEKATAFEIRKLSEIIISLLKEEGGLETGFRIYSNHGSNAHLGSEGDHFQMHVTIGQELGPSLTNCRNETL